jgi:hypothetical protein
LVRAIVVTPFLFRPAQFLFSFACAGVFWTTIALARGEVKRLRNIPGYRFTLAGRAGKCAGITVLTWHDISPLRRGRAVSREAARWFFASGL